MLKWLKRSTQVITKAVPLAMVPEWLTRTAIWSDFDAKTAIDEGYKTSPAVYACVKKRADAVASVPLLVERREGADWEAVPENHPLQQLLDYPNPDMDRGEIMRLMVTHLDLAGNSYMMKVRAGRFAAEIWPLMPFHIAPVPGRDRLISHYDYRPDGRLHTLPGEDVLHVAYCNPSSLYLGMSPLQAAGKAVDIDNAAASMQKISMQNRGIPDGIFSFDDGLTPDQFEQARQQVREQYSGVEGSRAPWVLGRAKYTQMSMTPAEMDFMASRHFSLKQICGVYGVPIEMIAGMGDANRASSDNVRRTFWLDTIHPLLDEVASTLNLSLAREFGRADQIRIRFDTSNVPALQENYSEKLDNARKLWGMGYPANHINQKLELGMDDIEGGDIGYIPSGVIPASFDLGGEPPEPKAAARLAYGGRDGANADGE